MNRFVRKQLEAVSALRASDDARFKSVSLKAQGIKFRNKDGH